MKQSTKFISVTLVKLYILALNMLYLVHCEAWGSKRIATRSASPHSALRVPSWLFWFKREASASLDENGQIDLETL